MLRIKPKKLASTARKLFWIGRKTFKVNMKYEIKLLIIKCFDNLAITNIKI